MKKSKKISFIIVLVCLFVFETSVIIADAAYFVRGKFKDVFINKPEYFSSDLLYSINSIEGEKEQIEIWNSEQNIFVYNHDMQTGDYNAFDVEFDVYVWLTAELPEGKEYKFKHYEGGAERSVTITTDHATPVASKTLKGGMLSTETFTISFGYEDGDNLTGVAGVNVVVVPTSPEHLSSLILGSIIVPTESEVSFVSGSFDSTENIEDYAAFIYRIKSVIHSQTGGKVVLKWNGNALTLMSKNQTIAAGVETISEESFTQKLEWTAKNNDTDVCAFMRNNASGTWDSEITWENLKEFVSVEYVEGVA